MDVEDDFEDQYGGKSGIRGIVNNTGTASLLTLLMTAVLGGGRTTKRIFCLLQLLPFTF